MKRYNRRFGNDTLNPSTLQFFNHPTEQLSS